MLLLAAMPMSFWLVGAVIAGILLLLVLGMQGQGQLVEKSIHEGGANGIPPQNISGTATTSNWISIGKRGHRHRWVIEQGAWAGGTPAVTFNQATSQGGAGSKALNPVQYYQGVGGATTTADILSAPVAIVSGTFNLPNQANTVTIIEIDESDLDFNNGFCYVQLAIASPGSNADYLCAHCEVYDLDLPANPTTLPSCVV